MIPLYVWISMIDTMLCAGIATLLLFRGRRQAWDISLFLYAMSLWSSIAWVYFFYPVEAARYIAPYLFDVALFFPALITLFALKVREKKLLHPALAVTVTLSCIFLLLSHFQSNFIEGTRLTDQGVFPVPGLSFQLFTAYFGLTAIFGLSSILIAYRKADSWHKARLQWITISALLALMGAGLYFYAVYTAQVLIPPSLFVIAATLTLAYSILKRRLYDIQLVTRGALTTSVTLILSTAPLILGRVFAPIVADLPTQSRLAATMTLFATLSFFAIAVTLVRYKDQPFSGRLARFFFLASLWNAVFFIWAVPRNAFTLPLIRTNYFIVGCMLFSWMDYRESLLTAPHVKFERVLALWKMVMFGFLMVAAATPWVLRYLEYYRTTLRPYAIVSGPLHPYFHAWMFLTPPVIGLYLESQLIKTAGPRVISQTLLLFASLSLGMAALYSFTLFGQGRVSWPAPMMLEVLAAAGILAHYLRQPYEGRLPSPAILTSIFVSTLFSCTAGFMLYYGLGFQILACLLLAVTMPNILSEFRGSAQALVDEYLFRSKFAYLSEIERLSEDLFQNTHLPTLLSRLADELTQRAELSWTGIWLFDLSEGRFLLRQAAGNKNTKLSPTEVYKLSFDIHDALPTYLKQERSLVLTADLILHAEDHRLEADALESRAISNMMRLDIAAVFPVQVSDGKLIGFLGFGHRVASPAFHQEDLEKLSQLGQKAQHAIAQAYMLYEQSLMFSKLAQDTLDFLQAMGMNIDILRNQYLGPLNDKQKRQLDIAAQQKEFIRGTLTDLRELERLMVLRMQGAWHMSRFDFKQVIEDALKAGTHHLMLKEITIESELHGVPRLLGDGRSIRRAIDNLLIQAFNMTPAKESVQVGLKELDDRIRLSILAKGSRIEEKDAERLFDPFYKGRPGTPLAYGTGLGLRVVKEVMALHLGRVWAENQPGNGILFVVELPLTNQ